MFKILSNYSCWKKYIKCNIWSVAVRPSYIKDAQFLKVKGPRNALGFVDVILLKIHRHVSEAIRVAILRVVRTRTQM